jgi:hypothetical protein
MKEKGEEKEQEQGHGNRTRRNSRWKDYPQARRFVGRSHVIFLSNYETSLLRALWRMKLNDWSMAHLHLVDVELRSSFPTL